MTYRDDLTALRLRLAQLDEERQELFAQARPLEETARLIDRAEVASPCGAKWENMRGDDRKRFCRLCKKDVYNVEALTVAEADALLRSGDEVCMRLYRRVDGTVLTADCPVGAVRRRKRNVAAGALLAAGAGLGFSMVATGHPTMGKMVTRPGASELFEMRLHRMRVDAQSTESTASAPDHEQVCESTSPDARHDGCSNEMHDTTHLDDPPDDRPPAPPPRLR